MISAPVRSSCFMASAHRHGKLILPVPPVGARTSQGGVTYKPTRGASLKASEAGSAPTGTPAEAPAPTPAASTVSVPAVATPSPIDAAKASLLDAITGTERGLVARSEVRAEINELINQLEVKGGQAADISSLQFEGTWELLYSNAADLIALLAFNRLPLPIKIGGITQTINATTKSVENSVQLQFPLMMTSLSTVSSYTVASPKRLQFTVQRGVLHTPSIEGNLELPSTVTFMGQTVDLAPLREVLAPLTRSAASLAASATDLLGQAPDLEVPLDTKAWQITTFLDSQLRITRGDGGAVYIFKKVITPLE